jgi:uncharacterized repeat protein (TIGR01451 family)
MSMSRLTVAAIAGAAVLTVGAAGALVVAKQSHQQSADIQVSVKAINKSAAAGGALVYRVYVTNNGPDTAKAVKFQDRETEGVFADIAPTPKSTQGSCTDTSSSPPSPSCDLGDIASGQTVVIVVAASVISRPPTAESPRGHVTAAISASLASDPKPGNNTATLSVGIAEPSPIGDSDLNALIDAGKNCSGMAPGAPDWLGSWTEAQSELENGNVIHAMSVLQAAAVDGFSKLSTS